MFRLTSGHNLQRLSSLSLSVLVKLAGECEKSLLVLVMRDKAVGDS